MSNATNNIWEGSGKPDYRNSYNDLSSGGGGGGGDRYSSSGRGPAGSGGGSGPHWSHSGPSGATGSYNAPSEIRSTVMTTTPMAGVFSSGMSSMPVVGGSGGGGGGGGGSSHGPASHSNMSSERVYIPRRNF